MRPMGAAPGKRAAPLHPLLKKPMLMMVHPRHMAESAAILKAVHVSEDLEAALEKAEAVCERLKAGEVAQGGGEGQSGDSRKPWPTDIFPGSTGTASRLTNPLERIMKEIRRRTRVGGAFPKGHSALDAVRGQAASYRWCQVGPRKSI